MFSIKHHILKNKGSKNEILQMPLKNHSGSPKGTFQWTVSYKNTFVYHLLFVELTQKKFFVENDSLSEPSKM